MSGYIAASLSAVFNGSFASLFKFDSVAKKKLHPMYFQLYVSSGVFFSSILSIPLLHFNNDVSDDNAGTSFVFSYLGIIAGSLLVGISDFLFLYLIQSQSYKSLSHPSCAVVILSINRYHWSRSCARNIWWHRNICILFMG